MAMSAELAAQIRAAGNDLPAISALYREQLEKQDRSGVILHQNVPYGEHERQVLDVYQPDHEQPPVDGWPTVVFFHGGGFIRGNKEHRQNLGWFLAQQGWVAVLANYRLAPETRWPGGAEDVVSVWQWARQQGSNYGVKHDSIVLMGESAGAAHVATASLRSELQPEDWQISGAVLLSGPYNARLEGLARQQLGIATPDPRNEAYFGEDRQQWDKAATVDHISAKPFPLLVSFTELDLLQMQVQAGELFARLVSQYGFQPELRCVPQHNHFSQGYSFGTEDDSVSAPLMRFLTSVV